MSEMTAADEAALGRISTGYSFARTDLSGRMPGSPGGVGKSAGLSGPVRVDPTPSGRIAVASLPRNGYAGRAVARHRARRAAWQASGHDLTTYRRIMRRWLRARARATGDLATYHATMRAWRRTTPGRRHP